MEFHYKPGFGLYCIDFRNASELYLVAVDFTDVLEQSKNFTGVIDGIRFVDHVTLTKAAREKLNETF